MKKLSFLFVGLLAVIIILVSWNNRHTAKAFNGAVHISDVDCIVLDGNFVPILTSGDILITPSDNKKGTCKAKGIANPTGKAIKYNFENTGIPCTLPSGETTEDWQEIISADGNMSLQCKFHD
jgi:hypothetical protein